MTAGRDIPESGHSDAAPTAAPTAVETLYHLTVPWWAVNYDAQVPPVDGWPHIPSPPPADPYDEDGDCRFCGYGRHRNHGVDRRWADLVDGVLELLRWWR